MKSIIYPNSRLSTRFPTFLFGLLTICWFLPSFLYAQAGVMGARERIANSARAASANLLKGGAKPQDKKDNEQEDEIGPPENVNLTTKDGVVLHCTYYPGTKSKTTIPLILLHDWEGNRKHMFAMASYLHENHKYSIIVPDLRGHGESTAVNGTDKLLELRRFKKEQLNSLSGDIERCKKFLMEKNNLGELNIEMLTLVVVGKMAVPAVLWTLEDWSWEPIGGRKQGKDVKAVMMISPERKLKSLSMTRNLKLGLFTGKGTKPIGVYLAWAAKDETADREGRAIAAVLGKSRSRLAIPLYQQRKPYKTSANASALVANPNHKVVFQDVAEFVETTIAANKEAMPWQNRSKK